MGSTDNQSNQKKPDATEPDESTTVDSSSVSTSKDDAEVSSIEQRLLKTMGQMSRLKLKSLQ